MHLDSNLRIEIISSLLGQTVKPYDKKGSETTDDILSVDDFHLHNLTGKRQAYQRKPVINVEDFFDPDYDCDFTHLADSTECTRGDELYERPTGWYRMALRVKSKYPDGDTWLGTKGWRSHSVPGEWPVSYHGTSLNGAKGIIRSHYKAGEGAIYGRGIYSTPDINVAEREEYAQTFTSKTTGKSYKVILQNRINPQKREVCQRFDYWLIRVDEGTSTEEEKKIVESSIRPYGILIKELKDDEEDADASDVQDSDDDNIFDDGYSNDSIDDSDYSISNTDCDDSGVHNGYDDDGDDNDDDDDERDDGDDSYEDDSGNENNDTDHFDADSTDHDGQYDEDTAEDCGDYDDDVDDGDEDGDSENEDDHDDDNGEDGDYDAYDDDEGVSDEDDGSEDYDNGEGDDYDDYDVDKGDNDEDDGSDDYDNGDYYDNGSENDDWS